jgi:hypothetical protein
MAVAILYRGKNGTALAENRINDPEFSLWGANQEPDTPWHGPFQEKIASQLT